MLIFLWHKFGTKLTPSIQFCYFALSFTNIYPARVLSLKCAHTVPSLFGHKVDIKAIGEAVGDKCMPGVVSWPVSDITTAHCRG